MALQKVDYVNQVTVITAENMNDIQDAIIALETAPAQGLTEDVKQALLQLAQKVAYIDDQGQTYYDDLYNALYPPKTVVSITAVFEQGSTVIYDDTALNDLKQYLQVTARYDDNTTAILADSAYSLSGLLEAPSSTVTVLYNGVSTTFSVAVTARPTLSSISATYTQSGTVYDTDTLDSLKDDLVVTAHYSDSSTQTVPAADYTLSGTLTEGTSIITVSYGGETTTFNVTVEHADPRELLYKWDFTKSLIDSVGNLEMTLLNSNGGSSLPTRDSDGLHFTDGAQVAYCSAYAGGYCDGRSYEMDIASAQFAGDSNKHKRLLMFYDSVGALIFRNAGALQIYKAAWMPYTAESGQVIPTSMNDLSGHTVKVHFSTDFNVYLYIDGVLVGKKEAWQNGNSNFTKLAIGGTTSGSASDGNQIYNCVITGLRVYNEEAN